MKFKSSIKKRMGMRIDSQRHPYSKAPGVLNRSNRHFMNRLEYKPTGIPGQYPIVIMHTNSRQKREHRDPIDRRIPKGANNTIPVYPYEEGVH